MKFNGTISSILFALAIAIGTGRGGVVVGSSLLEGNQHPLEDAKSWDLHVRRVLQAATDDGGNKEVQEDEETPYTIIHKKRKKHVPFAGGDTTHGMMIDAGSVSKYMYSMLYTHEYGCRTSPLLIAHITRCFASQQTQQGTRLHIYEWDKRFLLDEDDLLDVAHGEKLSIPTSNSRWTDKYTPGLDVFAYHKNPAKQKKALKKYLGPLLEFAKEILKDKEDQWHTYPIYLKATGGMRTLPAAERVRLIDAIRSLFHDHENFNPFSFEDERARVISGEEEAIYGWVGVNFGTCSALVAVDAMSMCLVG